jgi:hypothetical protein
MRTQSVVAVAIAGLFAVAAPTAAQAQGAWSVSFDAGLDSSWRGDAYGRATGNVDDQPVQVSARRNPNAYPRGLGWSVGIARTLSPRAELKIRVIGSMITSERRQTGRVGTANVNGTLFSDLDNLSEVGADVGLRILFRNGTNVQPYIGGFVGVSRVSEIDVRFDVPDAVFAFQENGGLYDSSTAATGGAGMGLQFNRSNSFAWYVNFEARFRGSLKADDAAWAGTGLEAINDSSSRWSLPLSVGVRLGF